jgi:hypothetical protein
MKRSNCLRNEDIIELSPPPWSIKTSQPTDLKPIALRDQLSRYREYGVRLNPEQTPSSRKSTWSIAGQDKLLDPVDSPGFKDGTGKANHADQ